jgi:hypothetical protein
LSSFILIILLRHLIHNNIRNQLSNKIFKMLRFNSLIFIIFLFICSCKSEKEKRMASQSEKKVKIIKHKNQNPTLENSDFLYNTESEEELKKHYKKHHSKRKELDKYQPSRRSKDNLEYENQSRKKKAKAPQTYY